MPPFSLDIVCEVTQPIAQALALGPSGFAKSSRVTEQRVRRRDCIGDQISQELGAQPALLVDIKISDQAVYLFIHREIGLSEAFVYGVFLKGFVGESAVFRARFDG